MSGFMREEFEAACEARFNWALQDPYRDESERTLSTWDGESYRNRIVQGMWWAWQASRECLVIKLPETKEIMPLTPDMCVHEMRKIVDENKYTIAIDLARRSIHAAGVKTK